MEHENHHGHQTSTNTQGQTNKPNEIGLSFIQKKAEKLTTALYMVSDIMSDKEPMKWKLRETGVEVLSDITLAAVALRQDYALALNTAGKSIGHVVSFLGIAESAHMISEMNASVLKKEYVNLQSALEKEWSMSNKNTPTLPEAFFDIPRALPEFKNETREDIVLKEKVETPAPIAREVAPIRVTTMPTQTPREVVRPTPSVATPVRDRVAPTGPARVVVLEDEIVDRTRSDAGRARNDVDRDDRRKIILALIKQKPALTVKDITKSIPQVSEKTIQRELLALVGEGLLVKKGERRWSTYSPVARG